MSLIFFRTRHFTLLAPLNEQRAGLSCGLVDIDAGGGGGRKTVALAAGGKIRREAEKSNVRFVEMYDFQVRKKNGGGGNNSSNNSSHSNNNSNSNNNNNSSSSRTLSRDRSERIEISLVSFRPSIV